MKSFVSIFSGCGGFDLGFTQAGYNCVGAFDIDNLVIDVHKRNLKTDAFITDLSEGALPKLSANKIDVLIAGPPCQGFSTAGKRRLNDPRNELLLAAGRIALEIKPKVVVIENVSGVTAGTHKQYWMNLRHMLHSNGYNTAEFKCEGTLMGVAQTRTRMILVGWNNKKEISMDLPQVSGGVLRDVIENIGSVPNHEIKNLDKGSDICKIAKRINPGQKLSNVRGGQRAIHTWDIPEVFGETSNVEKAVLEALLRIRRQRRVRNHGDADPVPEEVLKAAFGSSVLHTLKSLLKKGYVRFSDDHYDLMHTFNGKYRRLCWDKPSLTVDTRFGDPRYFLHPSDNRGFTVREAARIQGFPDDFIFHGPEKEQYKMIGNAVPPPLAKIVASFVLESLLLN